MPGRLLVLTTSLALGVITALSLVTGPPAAATTAAGLTYSCSYDVLGSNLPTPVVLDSDVPAVSGVKDPLNITTSMTLTMPASVAAKMEALPGFRTAQLSPDGASDGVSETYIAPTGRTPVMAHPVLSQLAPDGDGNVPFSGMSPAPYAMNPGPSVPGTYSLVVGTLSFQLHVDATTPVTYQISCQPPAVDVLVDTFRITAPTSTAVTVTGTWTYGDTPPGATATVTRTASASGWPAVSGTVQFYVDGDAVGAVVAVDSSGTATLAHLPATLEPGSHQISAVYLPDGASPYLTSTSTPSPVTVDIRTSVAITVAPASVEVGDEASATATVTGSDDTLAPGSVTFLLDAKAIDTIPLTSGTATITLPTAVMGHHSVTASYGGSGLYESSTGGPEALDVAVATTITRLQLDWTSAAYGEPVTASVTVSSAHATPTGSVTFTAGGRSVSATLVGGRARVTLPMLRPGRYQVLATFVPATGSNVERSSSAPAMLTVLRDATITRQTIRASRHGTRLVCAVDVAAVHGTPVTGRVRVTLKQPGRGHKTKSVLLEGGSRTVRFSGLPKHGRWSVVATYAGSGTLTPSISKVRRGGH
ncbi:Ig-like domain-containing protein [Nocardioides sp. Iso805N]|uniref:Ig-like domain-containing protein n=1 Tax=Nocardioides sp. Iso805N TaxID=1283287 RepID=UPI000367144E|nr:Ig-like domain-containing protein [Nocardioides sp. Iso805N]